MDISFFHLTVFESLLRLRSVSAAAEALDVPQPTFSRYLSQLRQHFGDPLFIRTRGGMAPTTVAASLHGPISEALGLFVNSLSGSREFDPATSDRTFHIAASDIGHLLILPGLEQACARSAPNVRFAATGLSKTKLSALLEAGEIDLAIGSFPTLFAGVRVQTLFREEYVCAQLALRGSPARELTTEQFKRAKHIVVVAHLLGHVHQEVERQVVAMCKGKNVRISTESFLLSALLAERTDLMLTVPSRVVGVLRNTPLRVLRPPIRLPGFDVKQYWHERFDRDPGSVWLRQTIYRLWRSDRKKKAQV